MVSPSVRRWIAGLRDFVLGSDEPCLHCGRLLTTPRERRARLCAACHHRIAWVHPPTCQRCGKPLRATTTSTFAAEGPLCLDCRSRPVPFAASFAAAVYDGLWKELIGQFKFYGRRELAVPLGVAVADVAWRASLPARVHALVPVPLHPQRLARRGYNQARELAVVIAGETGIPVLDALMRVQPGPGGGPQSLRSARQRRKSLRGAFVAWQPGALRGLTLAVVDDVYTTGATMDEASRALLRAGAREVWGLVAAVGVTDADLASRGREG